MDEQERRTRQAEQAAEGVTRTDEIEIQRVEPGEVVETLRLYEERAVIEVTPEAMGAVTIRRVVTEREETVPITLHSEHLEITVREGTGGRVSMGGEVLEVGRTYEVALYEEHARVEKQVYPLSDVTIAKQARTYTQTERVTLRREELDVEDPQGLVRDRTITTDTPR